MLMQFQQIPSEYLTRDNLYKYINPPDSIIWWEAGLIDMYSGVHEEIFCSDPKEKVEIQRLTSYNTYSSNYMDSFSYQSYLVYKTKSLKIYYVTKVEELKDFIGIIDNLAEALFLASIYGFQPSQINTGRSYCYKNGTYTFNMSKMRNPPDVIEIFLDENGKEIEQKSQKVKVKVYMNGDVFEMIGNKNESRKLEVRDMYFSQ